MKRIVYLIADNGVDGMAPTEIISAFYSEEERDKALEADKAKNWRTKLERIVDVEHAQAEALANLDGIERLVLGLPTWPQKTLQPS